MDKRIFAGLVLTITSATVWAGGGQPIVDFVPDERTTAETFPMQSIDEETLSNAIVEGGLAASAAGPSEISRNGDPIYMDPLDVNPNNIERPDRQTDVGRHEIPVEFRFSAPRQEIGLPQNVTYEYQTILLQER